MNELNELHPSRLNIAKLKNRNLFNGHNKSILKLLGNHQLELKYYFQTDEDKMLNKVRFKELQPSIRSISPVGIGSRRISLASSIKTSRIKNDANNTGSQQSLLRLDLAYINI